ncbi:MAG: glycosyl hydrolase [Candidatus Aminicenantes bacterium]|nr:glycosyl hydrolase [Candidatus Aminicenantes bacterium]
MRIVPILAALALLTTSLAAPAPTPAVIQSPDLAAGFRQVPVESRMRLYWRVFGPAWTEPEIDRQLAFIKSSGVGGVTVYFLYPVELDDAARGVFNQRFGSPEFLRTFGYAARKAAALGLTFSVNGGTGWPFGGPAVEPRDAALRLRRVLGTKGTPPPKELVSLAPGESIVAAFQGRKDITAAVRAKRLPDPLTVDIIAFISGPTGQQVKRASFGGEGQVLSHYDQAALERWLAKVAQPLFDAAPGLIRGFGCDSLEVYRSNWAPDLPKEFKRRRGYDLIPRLPELFDEAAPARRDLRHDFWRTLAELVEERFIVPLGRWCDRRGAVLEMEPYGTPPNPMTAGGAISLPTGEHYEWRGYCVQRYVSSMARIAGHNVVGAEAWTWSGIPNRLGDSLSDLKVVSDMTFLAGANDLTGVDFPYSPAVAGTPGWMPYYGPTLGPGNPQWAFFPALGDYLNRCQWLLRQGEPVRKVAVYLPIEDILSDGSADRMLLDFALKDKLVTGAPTSEFGLRNALRHHSDLLDGIVSAGFEYDGIDFWAVERLGAVKDRRLVVGRAEFEALVLPNLERLDLEALERVAAFCRAGGTVVATRRLPGRIPGLRGVQGLPRLRRLLSDLFGESPQPGVWHACGRGRAVLVTEDKGAGEILATAIVPQIRFSDKPLDVGFVHRRAGERDIYFLANVGAEDAAFTVDWPGETRPIEVWDAFRSEIRSTDPKGKAMEIHLSARGSLFLVAGGKTSNALAPRSAQPPPPDRIVPIKTEWTLQFDGPEAPPSIQLSDLVSWTEIPAGKFFSGLGAYAADFIWEGPLPERARLAFDQIREAAEIRLNGIPLGVLFNPPLEVDITAALRPGRNRLEVTVANLPLNRFLGLPDQDLEPLRKEYGNRFAAPEEKKSAGGPAPSGLIGPVRLIVYDKR